MAAVPYNLRSLASQGGGILRGLGPTVQPAPSALPFEEERRIVRAAGTPLLVRSPRLLLGYSPVREIQLSKVRFWRMLIRKRQAIR